MAYGSVPEYLQYCKYSMMKSVDIFVNAHTQKGELLKKAYVKRY